MSHRRHTWRKENGRDEQVNIKRQNKITTTEVDGMRFGKKRHEVCATLLCRVRPLSGEKHCLRHKPKGPKICANVKCRNHAPKDSIFCGNHRPKTTGVTNAYSKVGCHKGNVLVFTSPEGIEVYGGGSSREGGWWVMEPLPDLAIGPKEIVNKAINTHNFPEGWLIDSLNEPAIPIVAIDFPDYGVPKNLGKVFWLSLVEDIYTHGVKRISCQCMGGHGRTGVQLCILAHYLLPDSQHEWKDAGELIDWVRKHMCVHEVEARKQQDYVAKVCDIPVGEYRVEASKWATHSTSYGGDNWNFEGTQWSNIGPSSKDKIHTPSQSDVDLDDMVSPKLKELTGCDVYDRGIDDKIEEDDSVFECIDCDQREIWSDGLAPQVNGIMSCMVCQGEMIDITDLPETQDDIQYWMRIQQEDNTTNHEVTSVNGRVDIKEQQEEE
tara:strand:+ start:72 stop:1379 length:1308 start_codon:yes stop_codon:yes gene_type:complete